MAKADLFQMLGLYIRRRFLEAELCRRLQGAMREGVRQAATIRRGSDYLVDPTVRRVNWVELDSDLMHLVERRIQAERPQIERHFRLTLTGCQPLQFLAYGPGDFYAPHRDSALELQAPSASKARRISVIVFLNAASAEPAPDSYCGGALTLYGLLQDPRTARSGLPLEAEEGLLAAFPADTLHSVEPVTAGERLSVVTWFY